MSHFTVLVVGEPLEELLQPYHEFECTGKLDRYVQDVPKDVGKLRAEYEDKREEYEYKTFEEFLEDYHGLHPCKYGEELDFEGEHKYGWFKMDESGNVIAAADRTNPNAKWDWWQLGGRWTGFFKLKQGREGQKGTPGLMTPAATLPEAADQCRWGDIDIEGMREEARQEAGKDFDTYFAILKEYPETKNWKQVREEYPNIDDARKAYHEQPAVKAWWKAHMFADSPMDTYGTDREAYIEKQAANALSTFAILKDGKWYERGEMGWWATVSNEKDEKEWSDTVDKILGEISDDTLVSVVDCHI